VQRFLNKKHRCDVAVPKPFYKHFRAAPEIEKNCAAGGGFKARFPLTHMTGTKTRRQKPKLKPNLEIK